MLTFLQELLDEEHTPSTLKVYVAAITVNHALMAVQSVSKNYLVVKFWWGSYRLNLPHSHTMPTWNLSIVLPLSRSTWPTFWHLSLKTALLLVLALVK